MHLLLHMRITSPVPLNIIYLTNIIVLNKKLQIMNITNPSVTPY